MIKKLFYTILIVLNLLIYNSSWADSKINITGNERYDEETIKVYGNIKSKQNYSKNEINEILKSLYETNFFEDVKISFENKILNIAVKEYPLVSDIIIEGEKADKFKDLIFKRITTKKKGPYIKDNINQDVLEIKNLYEFLGFNKAEVESKLEELSNNRVNLYFFLEKGERLKISQIKFIGDKKVREKRLRDIIVSEENKFWKFLTRNTILNTSNIELDVRLLENYYKSLGYYDVKILSNSAVIDETGAELIYNISAGKRYKVTKVSTNISDALDKKVFLTLNKDFEKVVGDFYSPFKIKNLLDELDRLINFNDLQFIEHSVNEIVSNDGIEVIINIFEGRKNLVERINIYGNSITNEDVIRSELLLDEGDPFNNLKLDQSIAKLRSKDIFATVKKEVKVGSEPDLQIIDITIEEKPTGEISAGAGVGSDGGTVQVGIKENNWLGTGVNLSSFLEVNDTSVKGNIEYKNPNFNYTGNSLNFNAGVLTNDQLTVSGYKNDMISLGASTDFEQFTNIYIQPGVFISSDDLSVDDTASSLLKKQAGTFNEFGFDYQIRRDERDKVFMPTKGYVASFYQSLPLVSDASSIRNTIAIANYKSFGEDIVGSLKFYASAVNGLDDDVRISKRIFLPSNRLRGFKTRKVGPLDGSDYVGGNYASAINLEANLPNLLPDSTKADVSLFFDAANLWGVDYNSGMDDSNEIRSSVGLNTSWLSPIGPLTFTFSKEVTKADTDQTQGFKFNLGTTF